MKNLQITNITGEIKPSIISHQIARYFTSGFGNSPFSFQFTYFGISLIEVWQARVSVHLPSR